MKSIYFIFLTCLLATNYAAANSDLTGQTLLDSKKANIICGSLPAGNQRCASSYWLATACDDKLLPILESEGFVRKLHYRSHYPKDSMGEEIVNVFHTYSNGERTIQLTTKIYLNEAAVKARIAKHISKKGRTMANRYAQEQVDEANKNKQIIDRVAVQEEFWRIVEEESVKEREALLNHFMNVERCSTTFDVIQDSTLVETLNLSDS